MPIASDPYPTRLHQTRAPIPRREPTVYDPGDRQGPLDAAALERFEQDGFLVLENYLSRGTLRPFLDDLEVYARDPDLRQRQEVITEPDSGGIRSIFGVHRLSARVDALTRDPLLLIPGSHQTFLPTLGATPEHYWETSLRRQKVGVPELDDLHRAARAGGVVPASGGPGTVTVFDCNTLHASSDNLSPLPRDDVEPLLRTRTSQVA
ncbi:MAG: phytanoyl-CoA dioxygenase family protein [Pseudomonadales bacterium]